MDKTGFISVVGRPNVGKSTLLNRLVGEKISIISNKPQTTRENIQIIYSDQDSQIIFIDTPGLQQPRNLLQKKMAKSSKSALNDMDVILYIVDDSDYIGRNEKLLLDLVTDINTPIILGINKIDKLNPEKLIPIISMYDELNIFKEIVPFSGKSGENVDRLLEVLKMYLPEGPRYYPDDQITNKTERFLIEEIIREKLLQFLKEEVPHGIYVEMESMDEENDNVHIDATIYTERSNHRGIILGRGGSMIKRIRKSAEEDLTELLGKDVTLSLWIKVDPNWRDKESTINKFGI